MSTSNQPKIKIAQLRKKLGLTQLDVAMKVGVRESTIANWENGRSGAEWVERLVRLCDCLKCRPEDLIEYLNNESKPVLETNQGRIDKFQGQGDGLTKSNLDQWQGRCDSGKNDKSPLANLDQFQGQGKDLTKTDINFSISPENAEYEATEKFQE